MNVMNDFQRHLHASCMSVEMNRLGEASWASDPQISGPGVPNAIDSGLLA